jgi:hypothetical protein
MMIKGLFCVLLALFAVACAPDRVDLPATMSVSPDFSPEETEAIFAAADAWSAATKGVARLDVSVGDGGGIRVVPYASDDTDPAMARTHVVSAQHADMRIDSALTDATADRLYKVPAADALRDTVMHELGHAFGLDHVPGGLMRAEGYGGGQVDADTLQRFCAEYSCSN